MFDVHKQLNFTRILDESMPRFEKGSLPKPDVTLFELDPIPAVETLCQIYSPGYRCESEPSITEIIRNSTFAPYDHYLKRAVRWDIPQEFPWIMFALEGFWLSVADYRRELDCKHDPSDFVKLAKRIPVGYSLKGIEGTVCDCENSFLYRDVYRLTFPFYNRIRKSGEVGPYNVGEVSSTTVARGITSGNPDVTVGYLLNMYLLLLEGRVKSMVQIP